MRERDVERRLVERVRALGGVAYKFTAPGRRSVPDRIVLLPGRPVIFVECKAPGCRVTQSQAREIERITRLGTPVYVLDSYDEVDRYFPEHDDDLWRVLS